MCVTLAVPNNTLPRMTTGPDVTAGFRFLHLVRKPPNRRLRIMPSNLLPRLRIRVSPENPDHHLWNNHGTWFIHYTVHPTPFTKERVRRSLGTRILATARERRDAIFARWGECSPDRLHPAEAA